MRRRRLGQELRRLRESLGLLGNDVAGRLRWSTSKLSRIEGGRTAPTPADVNRLLDLYGMSDDDKERDKLAKLTKEARKKGWWQLYSDVPYSTYIGLEAEAAQILTYEHVVPGLLQTTRYAEEINRATDPGLSEEALEQRVDVRMHRQKLLTEGGEPLEVRAVLDESALRRMVGDRDVMREQLHRLLEVADLPNVLLQVIPFSAGAHRGTLEGPFIILRFPDQEDPDVVYVEANSDQYPSDVPRYELAFDNLRAAAAGVPETLTLIRNMVKDL
ncbi:helix-turn-helix domain-containing protein [Streptomyces benahoarensis]|uniref:Helix-turn-helix domain-containing protein n=1 Tax=Streptomyces benahoarensis TaxID=2595054 RepID=A0A553ZA56_9ACTN|nr:helix-turn-helix domain-containing protein [Streptomyces benahoarensis]TSB38287.1 helix-turn-helix domain-containing protein [Streptomyces benahoarensis]